MTAILNTGDPAATASTAAPEGHDAAMTAKFDAQDTGAPPATTEVTHQRPSWLPEKFATVEDFAKSYGELEAKLGAPKPPETPKTPDAPATPEAAAETVAKAGLDFDALTTEFTSNGKLSDETYAKMEAGGIPRSVADSYIAGQQALADGIRTTVFGHVGGEEQYSDLVTWAGENLSDAEITAYDNAMNSRDVNTMKLAVDGLKARMTSVVGTKPNLVGGESGGAAPGATFRSTAELTAAMKDPRYTNDPAYREDVRARLGRSNIM